MIAGLPGDGADTAGKHSIRKPPDLRLAPFAALLQYLAMEAQGESTREAISRRVSGAIIPPETITWKRFRQQEIALTLMSLLVLAAVIALPLLFSGESHPLRPVVVIVVYARFTEQLGELLWFALRTRPVRTSTLKAWVGLSILIHVAFAYTVSLLSLSEATHFVILMLIPLIAAAFRISLAGMLLVLVSAVVLTFLEIFLTFRAYTTELFAEYYHAATVAMMFIVVAVMVRLLSGHQKRSERDLRESLDELQRTRDRLVAEENLAAVGRLSSAIAHEIRNPIAMISSSVAMVKKGDTSRNEILEIVEREAGRLERLTTEFLSYARPKSPELRRNRVRDSMDYVASLAGAKATEGGLAIEVECPDDLYGVYDGYQVHQALLNLVLNAIDATPSGGRVALGARAGSGDTTVLWVENSGDPVPQDAMSSRIFEPFYTTKKTGTGLGLAIARNIVRAHQGMLMLASNKPGKVRFEMALPNGGAG